MLESSLNVIIGIMSVYVCIIAAIAIYMKFKKNKLGSENKVEVVVATTENV